MIDIRTVLPEVDTNEVSDGYHTFGELYAHRIELFIALCRIMEQEAWRDRAPRPVWRSKLHSDGSSLEGWFVLGIYQRVGYQITYHLPIARWDDCAFADREIYPVLDAPDYSAGRDSRWRSSHVPPMLDANDSGER